MTKYQIFTILPRIPHFHKNRNFSRIFATFSDQLLHPYKCYGRDMSGILFFIFASCEPLSFLDLHCIFHRTRLLSYIYTSVKVSLFPFPLPPPKKKGGEKLRKRKNIGQKIWGNRENQKEKWKIKMERKTFWWKDQEDSSTLPLQTSKVGCTIDLHKYYWSVNPSRWWA